MAPTPNAIRYLIRRTFASASGVPKVQTSQGYHGAVPTKEKPLMDLLPIPEGPWQEHYNKQNAKYNLHLIGGVLFFALSFGILFQKDFLFINATPPLPKK